MRKEAFKFIVGFCISTLLLISNLFGQTGKSDSIKVNNGILKPVSLEEFDNWFENVKNWGRWGQNDTIGTLNLITPGKRKAASKLVKKGITVSLAHNLETDSTINNSDPMELKILTIDEKSGALWVMESLAFKAYHGFANSHMDWFSHTAYKGKFYGGISLDDITPTGVKNTSVHHSAQGFVSRGVIIDAAELLGVEYLQPGIAITTEKLIEWEKLSGVKIQSGDILLIRTGRWFREQKSGPWKIDGFAPGLHPSVALWLHERGVAALGSDVVNDVMPSPVKGIYAPLHQLTLVAMGMPLFDNLDLEDLIKESRKQNRKTFLFIAAPLRLKGGTGSPMNPIAVF